MEKCSIAMFTSGTQGLSDVFLRSILVRMRFDAYPPGETVVMEGEIGSNMFFISKGQLHVSVKSMEVARLGEGEFFGEVAMYHNNGRRTATVGTITYCEVRNLLVHAPLVFVSQLATIARAHYFPGDEQVSNISAGVLPEPKRYGGCSATISIHHEQN